MNVTYLRGALLAAFACILVGASFTANSVLGDYPYAGGQALRYGLAGLLLVPLLSRAGGPRPVVTLRGLTGRQWGRLALLAAVGMVGFNLAVLAAERSAEPAVPGCSSGARRSSWPSSHPSWRGAGRPGPCSAPRCWSPREPLPSRAGGVRTRPASSAPSVRWQGRWALPCSPYRFCVRWVPSCCPPRCARSQPWSRPYWVCWSKVPDSCVCPRPARRLRCSGRPLWSPWSASSAGTGGCSASEPSVPLSSPV